MRSKEYVYGVSRFWDLFWLSLDQVGTMFSLPLLLSYFLNNLSICWFAHILTQVLQWRSCRPLVLFTCHWRGRFSFGQRSEIRFRSSPWVKIFSPFYIVSLVAKSSVEVVPWCHKHSSDSDSVTVRKPLYVKET